MPLQAEGLPERLQAATGDPAFARLDLHSAADVDKACSALLQRLDETNDLECSALIADLAGPPLAVVAQQLGRELGLGFATEELVIAVLGRLLADVPLAPRRITHFLAHVTDLMRSTADEIVEELKKGVVLPDGDVVRPRTDVPLPELPERKQQRTFQVCFHRLDRRDRQILRAKEIEGLPAGEIAGMLGLQASEVPNALASARLNLLDELERATERGAP